MSKILLYNIGQIATFLGSKPKHGKQMQEVKIIPNGSILIEDGKISNVFDSSIDNCQRLDVQKIDCHGKLVTAGYVDCHTHLVFGGNRAKEFEMRLAGKSYMEIMQAGGGIVNTVTATRETPLEKLLEISATRVKRALANGVTTVEVKSGYGLDKDTELKQLEIAQKLNQLTPVEVVPTFMGAHATPKGMTADEYVDFVLNVALPAVKQQDVAEFCDCFCEKNVFDAEQSAKILQKAKELGMGLKLHADEIESIGGIGVACGLGAISVEHLLKISDQDIQRLATSDTVGVVLPATAFSLKEEYAPARKMIDAGCAVALATDFNPGSCNTQSIPLVIALANIYCKMTMAETLCALTLNGACAIGRGDKIGTVEVGKQADLLIHNVDTLQDLCYNFVSDTVDTVLKKGNIVLQKNN